MSAIEYKKVKTRKDKLIEQGLPINHCKFIITVGKTGQRTIELVYKAIKSDPNDDKFLLKRIRIGLKLPDTTKYKIKKIKTLSFMGYGKYEE